MTSSGRASPVELGRYKAIEPRPKPAAAAFVTKILPGAGPAALSATEEAADATGEVAKPVPDTIAATRAAKPTLQGRRERQAPGAGTGTGKEKALSTAVGIVGSFVLATLG